MKFKDFKYEAHELVEYVFDRVCVAHLFSFLCCIICFVCVPNVASVFELSILDSFFSNVYLIRIYLKIMFRCSQYSKMSTLDICLWKISYITIISIPIFLLLILLKYFLITSIILKASLISYDTTSRLSRTHSFIHVDLIVNPTK